WRAERRSGEGRRILLDARVRRLLPARWLELSPRRDDGVPQRPELRHVGRSNGALVPRRRVLSLVFYSWGDAWEPLRCSARRGERGARPLRPAPPSRTL